MVVINLIKGVKRHAWTDNLYCALCVHTESLRPGRQDSLMPQGGGLCVG